MTTDQAEERLAGSRRLYAYLNCFFPLRGARTLDAGCGSAAGLLAAAENGVAEALGVDLDLGAPPAHSMHELARKLGISTETLRVLQADVGTFPGYTGFFDGAVSMDSVEHVADLDQYLANIFDVLKPGGVAAIECGALYYSDTGGHLWNYFDPAEMPWVHLYRDLPELLDQRGVSGWIREEFAKLNGLTLGRLRDAVRNAGFEIVDERVGESSRGRLSEFRDRLDLSRVCDEEDLYRQWTRIAARKPQPVEARVDAESGEATIEAHGRVLRGGGPFQCRPALAIGPSPCAVLSALGVDGRLWAAGCDLAELEFGPWQSIEGAFRGAPAAAWLPSGGVFAAARDEYGAIWLMPFEPPHGFGAMIKLGGVFATDPQVAVACDGSLHLWAADAGTLVWWGRFSEADGFSGWTHM